MTAVPTMPMADEKVEVPSFGVSSLAESMALLAMLTVVQRGVGFVRGVLFCRWLPAEQLGQWDLVFGFLMLAAPLVVLGIPGSFGRYVEHFRQRGELRTFLRRTTAATILLSVVGCLGLWLLNEHAANLLFRDPSLSSMIPIIAATLASVVSFNYFVELFIAMRRMRTVSVLQFMNSVLFAGVAVGLMSLWEVSARSVILAYGGACAATAVVGVVLLIRNWRSMPGEANYSTQSAFWRKLLPFAAWLWTINLLSNLFEVVDRYMIVHFSGLTAEVSQALVGDYHSSRVVPWLMVAVANLLGGILLPHLSSDWESGNRLGVSRQINLILKMGALAMSAGALIVGFCAPFLFDYVFAGKYDGGLTVLPWTLTYCVWYSLSGFAMLYFCCAEKTHVGAIVYGVGLSSNVLLNAALLPMFGLTGAVLATALANAITICLAMSLAARMGLEVQTPTLLLCAMPLLLGIDFYLMAAVLVVLAWQANDANWLLDDEEKNILRDGMGKLTNPLKRIFA